ncbi:MAG: biotin/lipoyl-containing protein [Vicinamibacterales bacterium]
MSDPVVTSLGGGWYIVDDGERRWRVAVAGSGDTQWVFVNGQVATVEAAKTGRRRSRSRETGIMSPMPATVVAVHVAPGQAVTEGETLIVLEAMKMELPIRAPRDGVVKTVACRAGELVQPGVNLLEFE